MTTTGDAGREGAPFGDDYLDLAEGRPTSRTYQRVQQQVTDLRVSRSNPGVQRELSRAISSRYQERRDRQLGWIAGTGGVDVLLVDGEVLITDRTWAHRGAREYLQRRGLQEAELGCPELESRLTRLVAQDEVAIQRLDDTVAELRSRGFGASLTHVTPMAPVIKNLGGPALGESLGAFADYPAFGRDGAGSAAKVAVIDTGIDGSLRSDGWLDGVARYRDDPSTHHNESNIDLLDNDPPDGFLDFAAGHGTFAAGVVAQVAPGADISVYRALRGGGAGSELEVACSLVRAVREGAQVVNLSLGSHTRYDQPSIAIAAALEVVAEIEAERGEEVLVVCAAGNYGDTTPTWPAAFRRVVSVGAVSSDLKPTTWSSRGFWVDCSAVGEGVLSTFVEGSESYEYTSEPDTFGPNAFARWSGTSFAAPQITGGIARLMQERDWSPRQAYTSLLAAGIPVPDFGQAMRILPGL
ncbi:S8 family peptidase [Cellulomonas soli]